MMDLLKYPQLFDHTHPEGRDLNCDGFVLQPGRTLLISDAPKILIKIGDWDGNDLTEEANRHTELLKRVAKLIAVMRAIKIPQAQFYFTANAGLCDVQVSINKLLSYTMINELFSKSVPVVGKVLTTKLDDGGLKELRTAFPDNDIVLKPCIFKYSPQLQSPLYFKRPKIC